MHAAFHIVMGIYLGVLAWVSKLATFLATIAGRPLTSDDYALAAVVASSLILAAACAAWAIAERLRLSAHRHASRASLARAQADIRFREAVISAGPEAIAVLGADMSAPLTYRGGGALLQSCLDGPDAQTLAAKLEALIATGTAFTLRVRTASFPVVTVRGCAVGSRAAVFFRIDRDAAEPEADFCAAMDALPAPVWIRNKHLVLTWANRAFLAATGSPTLRDALLSDASLDRSERDLARAASEGTDIVNARRYVVIDGERKALAIDMRRLPDASVAGFALDMTEVAKAEARLQLNADATADLLNALDIGVAVFGADGRLTSYNGTCARMWHIPEPWLDAHPSLADVLDRLREMRRLPEQRDFAGWKRKHLIQFDESGRQVEETWHSPSGVSVEVTSRPYLLGGVVYLFRDISERIRLEASYNMLVRAQRATLNTVSDAMAVFGPDGRLKLHNDAFARLWQITEEELAGEPHLTKLADMCAGRTGRDGIWSMISAGVNASDPSRFGAWGKAARADGRSLTLSLVRLPEGATLVTFTDVTDLERFESALVDEDQSSVA